MRASRRLVYFPIVHTPNDMGALSASVAQENASKLGLEGWRRNVQAAEQLWKFVEDALFGLDLNFQGARVYQDSLPECGVEAGIVAELAKAGSRNHRLLAGLEQRGAILMGTEAPELLLEEYQLIKETYGSGNGPRGFTAAAQRRVSGARLLRRRDRHIAARINGTLEPGETGILFLGLLHNVAPLLDGDIQVEFPVLKPWAQGKRR